ncbi:TlpA family protein disulfide reductase [Hyunsoonleella flava]|uniref:TlpA family protein disulfide reductase n=1 Tax=Hyunsoonleella flava TaxID=2527939 RepID=A0A4Q9FC82_9FLAO|nr:TlpA disulfide reductase family protein [Hyunsoonleella flava]TBN00911.1 TlpA family protein disulfide reductase [Hyunsoonleella flava]
MTKIYLLILTFISFLNIENDKEILNKTIVKLNSLKTIEYELVTHDYVKDYNINKIDSAYCYFDFTSKDKIIGAKYQIISKLGEQVFNGKQKFTSIPKKELVLYSENATKSEIISSKFLSPSIFEIRKILPELVIDSSAFITKIKDSTINNIECYQFKILMTQKSIGMGGELKKFDTNKIDSLNYHLFISKKTYLPIQFGTILHNNGGYQMSTFNNLKEVTTKNISVWDYNNMPKEYMKISYSDYFMGMRTKNKDKIGLNASDWKLPMVQGDSIKLSELKNNLVLLEFWFPYCKGCIQAVPELNEIQDKYKTKGLLTFGIEFTKKSENILIDYIEKQKIKFPTLYMGNDVAKEYGIYAAPTFVLIDKNGKIIYNSASLNKEQLIKKIENNL